MLDFAEPNGLVVPDAVPNDTSFSTQWGLHNTGQSAGTSDADVDAPEAWDLMPASPSEVVVAVLDTGVDYNHPDLNTNMWVNPSETIGDNDDDDRNGIIDDKHGADFAYEDDISSDGDPMDDSIEDGHGTKVAGVIGAVGNNSQGIAGVTWKTATKIMAVKVLTSLAVLPTATWASVIPWTSVRPHDEDPGHPTH
jgi:subtilisin family serine protease